MIRRAFVRTVLGKSYRVVVHSYRPSKSLLVKQLRLIVDGRRLLVKSESASLSAHFTRRDKPGKHCKLKTGNSQINTYKALSLWLSSCWWLHCLTCSQSWTVRTIICCCAKRMSARTSSTMWWLALGSYVRQSSKAVLSTCKSLRRMRVDCEWHVCK